MPRTFFIKVLSTFQHVNLSTFSSLSTFQLPAGLASPKLREGATGQVINVLDSDGLEYWVGTIMLYNNYHHLTQRLLKGTNPATPIPNFTCKNILPKKRKTNIFFLRIYSLLFVGNYQL